MIKYLFIYLKKKKKKKKKKNRIFSESIQIDTKVLLVFFVKI